MTPPRLSRRKLCQLTGASALGALAGCAEQLPGIGDDGGSEVTPRSPVTAEPDRSVTLTAASGTVRPAQETSATNWLYGGQFPGPELRVQEGDVLSTQLVNDLHRIKEKAHDFSRGMNPTKHSTTHVQ